MIKLENKPNVTAPNAAYPFGNIKDKTSSEAGTGVNVAVYGDMHQFFAKLFAASGLTANGLPDNESNGFQLYKALLGVVAPIGSITPYFGIAAPNTTFLLCNGQAISRTTYAELFTLIGTTFGVGDGSTTFNIPNTKGKFLVGYDPADSDYNAIDSTKVGGEKTHILTNAEMPATVRTGGTSTSFTESGGTGNAFMSTAPGGATAHENRPPYITVNYLIKAK